MRYVIGWWGDGGLWMLWDNKAWHTWPNEMCHVPKCHPNAKFPPTCPGPPTSAPPSSKLQTKTKNQNGKKYPGTPPTRPPPLLPCSCERGEKEIYSERWAVSKRWDGWEVSVWCEMRWWDEMMRKRRWWDRKRRESEKMREQRHVGKWQMQKASLQGGNGHGTRRHAWNKWSIITILPTYHRYDRG